MATANVVKLWISHAALAATCRFRLNPYTVWRYPQLLSEPAPRFSLLCSTNPFGKAPQASAPNTAIETAASNAAVTPALATARHCREATRATGNNTPNWGL